MSPLHEPGMTVVAMQYETHAVSAAIDPRLEDQDYYVLKIIEDTLGQKDARPMAMCVMRHGKEATLIWVWRR